MVVVEPKQTPNAPPRRYLRAPVPVHFPSEEKVPESLEHVLIRTALFLMLRNALEEQAVVGSEQFVYWDPTDPKQCLSPDIFVRMGGPDRTFQSWKVWERGAPHLAIEIISDSDGGNRVWKRKLAAYQRSGILELVRFDPTDAENSLRLWDRVQGDLVEREVSKLGLERSDALGLYWLVEPSPEFGLMLRPCRDAAGRERLLTDREELLVEAEARRAAEAQIREAEAQAREANAQTREAEVRIRELEAELARYSKG
jgi:Uma2 family endonuclease